MSKTLVIFLTILTTAVCWPAAVCAQTGRQTTVRQQMEQLHRERKVNFVYDANLDVDMPYKGPPLKGMPLQKALHTLFSGTGIGYKQQGKYVLLSKPAPPETKSETRKHTLSGHIRDRNGETLINATVYDLGTAQGTMTNEYGFFSLTLAEGNHTLRVTYIGYEDRLLTVSLRQDQHLDITLEANARLGEVVVTGDMNSPVLTTQTGKRSFSQQDIKTEFALLSSPDVVKTLQRTSGVQEGIELASGMYVHGGNNDENLFLIDGTPLYQINHSMGLFSAFNADVVKNVDFYKSGFPARYGGRLSSVVDVRTNDGDLYHWHGSYRIGLLDGSVQLEGPLKPGRTALNIGLRRSWLDLITRPAFAIANHFNNEEKIKLNYNFHDLNAKLTHVVSERSRLSLSLYSGRDHLHTKDDWRDEGNTPDNYDNQIIENKFNWGNFNAALNWNYQFSPRLMGNFTAVYTHNRAKFNSLDDWQRSYQSDHQMSYISHGYRSTIYDAGYRTEFDYRPSPRHHIRFGHDYLLHLFRPQTQNNFSYINSNETTDTIGNNSRNRHLAHEMTLYAEDELRLSDQWSLNGGVNLGFFHITHTSFIVNGQSTHSHGKTFLYFDPRMAVKWQPLYGLSLKASYTLMTQFVHKISNSFLDFPTDYWVPTTARLRPMHSHQLAAGVYVQPNHHWLLSAEGYYKYSRHLLQYSSWAGLEPPATSWDSEVADGEGKYYGMELDARYQAKHVQLQAAYTLSWNKRRFDAWYDGWYYDKFDNRHKLNLTGRFQLGKKTEAFAAWTFHTGNRMTFPTQEVSVPYLPQGTPDMAWNAPGTRRGTYIYEQPNNIVLPAYHRLDLGFNFHHTTKHGHERIWNLSLYNAYCHLNALWVSLESEDTDDGKTRYWFKTHGFFPIIPSFSYTIKF